MSQTDLFDMEWYIEDGKNEIKIDAPSLFQETERELKSYILEEQPEGDSTDVPISSEKIWQIKYKKILMILLATALKKRASSNS